MILDSEAQRKFLLQMIEGVNFPGLVLDQAFSTKQAIKQASIAGGEFATESQRECSLAIVK